MKRLLKLALIVGIILAIARMLQMKKAEWSGLTEHQVREKLDTRMPSRIPTEKRSAMQDNVVAKMRSKGLIAEELAPVGESTEDGRAADAV